MSTQVLQKWRPCEHQYAIFSRTISDFMLQVSNCWRAIPLGFGVCASQDAEAPELHCWWVYSLLYGRFFSHILLGWLCAIGWQVYLAGVCFMVGIIIQGLIALNVADYEWENWHGTLLTIAVVAFSIVFNTFLATRLPLIEGTVLILHLAGFFGIIIPLWVMAPRAHPHILLEFSNNGGWSTTGVSAMIGLTTPLSVLIGYDCSVHMCKEFSLFESGNEASR